MFNLNNFNLIEENSTFIGSKSYNLSYLKNKGFNIANGYIIPSFSFNDNEKINNIEEIDKFDENKLYAIRSSALGEDGKENSFAGIFQSDLFIKKKDILNSINKINDSFYSKKAEIYLKLKKTTIKPCILIQEMIESELSAILFIKDNKITMNIKKGYCDGIASGKEASIELNFDLKNILLQEKIIKSKLNFDKNIFIEDLNIIINNLLSIYENNLDIEITLSNDKWYILQIRKLNNF